MKCEKCGKEASFYYRSNINGKVTTMNLCSECADKSGIEMMDMNSVFDSMYNDMFNVFGSMFTPMMMNPWRSPGMMRPRIHIMLEPANDANKTETKSEQKIDPEMSKRREINALREQMNAAVKNEEFEKAAELRDRIRELDNRANG